ncbi:alpha/beta fold hydrolase [Aquisalimonas asiatica]|uniref:Pimeloyl-ACP methyl ester carboxylesterase n=1 Tax=Aquisalimonas asiatica TaxID=406100 RepID=A0A1H8Q5Q1_9GAMM|nr:alpha/beta hydrolase [Aquisalimonas asiatica]SEO49540.1 Pimeloyl-ACP methyl ester carboxylesterase [Aquisalimonas asiatica]
MPYVTIAGAPLHYTLHDEDAPLDLVCIHGAGGDHTLWPRGLGELPSCNTHVLDLPGHGLSGGDARDSVSAYAEVVETFVAELELRRVVLLGHSMGGAIALQIALDEPRWLDSLILACTGCRLRVPEETFALYRSDPHAAVERQCQLSFSPVAPQALIDAEAARRRDVPPEVMLRDYSACDRFDITDTLGEITVPALVISGDIDHLTPLKYAQFLEDRIPDARLAVVAPAGHMLPLEQPGEITRLVSDFVGRRVDS